VHGDTHGETTAATCATRAGADHPGVRGPYRCSAGYHLPLLLRCTVRPGSGAGLPATRRRRLQACHREVCRHATWSTSAAWSCTDHFDRPAVDSRRRPRRHRLVGRRSRPAGSSCSPRCGVRDCARPEGLTSSARIQATTSASHFPVVWSRRQACTVPATSWSPSRTQHGRPSCERSPAPGRRAPPRSDSGRWIPSLLRLMPPAPTQVSLAPIERVFDRLGEVGAAPEQALRHARLVDAVPAPSLLGRALFWLTGSRSFGHVPRGTRRANASQGLAPAHPTCSSCPSGPRYGCGPTGGTCEAMSRKPSCDACVCRSVRTTLGELAGRPWGSRSGQRLGGGGFACRCAPTSELA
jgi:hypothetical protein